MVYEFIGSHLVANYIECDETVLNDAAGLEKALKQACVNAKATILNSIPHQFEPQGFSMIILLSESHASIHTYPEHGGCFVDFFTCGTTCDPEKFHETLTAYLKPKKVTKEILERKDHIEKEHLAGK